MGQTATICDETKYLRMKLRIMPLLEVEELDKKLLASHINKFYTYNHLIMNETCYCSKKFKYLCVE